MKPTLTAVGKFWLGYFAPIIGAAVCVLVH